VRISGFIDQISNAIGFNVTVLQGYSLAGIRTSTRDPARSIPDSCYDVTRQLGVRHHITRAELKGLSLHLAGHGYLHRIATEDVTTELVLRERDSGTEYRLPVTHTTTPGLGKEDDEGHYLYETAGFEVRVDLATAGDGDRLSDGLWDISLAIGAQGIGRTVRIGSRRDPSVSGKAATHIVNEDGETRAVTLYATRPHGNLTLDIGERKHAVPPQVSVSTVRWAPGAPTALEFTGRCALAGVPDGTLAVHLEDGRGGAAVFPAHASPSGGDVVARVPVTECRPDCGAGSCGSAAGHGTCRHSRRTSPPPNGAAAACLGTRNA
jgi:CDP-glycerol glycerophosphotransferase